ncbi:MAG TPA: ring-cleaving dioxygenase [Gemmatimonadales bacterium]|nr:ring-cleaving dioxygenase [Gemmatimonadales bacterium]
MKTGIQGLHHVTATVADAQEDLDFYTILLGLRLVKKTVNFDNHHVFHFYYGDETGTPGTIWTTFPYKGKGVAQGSQGTGQISTTSFAVPKDSIDFWSHRLIGHGLTQLAHGERFGDEFLMFTDPSGLFIELVATDRDTRTPWTIDQLGPEHAIRGLYGVNLMLRELPRSIDFLTQVLGWEVAEQNEKATRVAINGGGPGKTMDLLHTPNMSRGINGLGTVHHVAMAIPDGESQLAVREKLVRLGFGVTEVRDRQYFQSIYFREPGGVLYEIATISPGFTSDESVEDLGKALKLPPWEEPDRAEIEAGLPEVALRR